MKAVIDKLEILQVEVYVAVIFFKPKNNQFPGLEPEYCVYTTEAWLVFPHELEGLSKDEIIQNYGEGAWYLLKSTETH